MNLKDEAIGIAEVRAARQRISPYIHRTPILTSTTLDTAFGCRVFFKCENFQKTGAFKVRGAFNALLSLPAEERARGIVTSSSGNQAAAASFAAGVLGVSAYIAMPKIAIKSKVAAVERYGGNIVWVESAGRVPTSEEYDATAETTREITGASPVHPYDDPRTIAGQGTCALELLEDCPDLDVVLAPVGGGGLLSGTCLSTVAMASNARVIGCEPEMADDAQKSLRQGVIVPQTDPQTIADGLRTSLGELTFPIISRHVADIVTVSEESILMAMRHVWETMKIIIEPSAAVPVAALLEGRIPTAAGKVGVILSGGNVDFDSLPEWPV